jgi:cell division protein ZapA
MGQVTVVIADKTYRIACDDGQEEHLTALASDLDTRIGQMRRAFGEIGDNRLTVMAAITCLDEGSEVKRRLAELEGEVAALRAERDAWGDVAEREAGEVAAVILEAAERIEGVARTLGQDRIG